MGENKGHASGHTRATYSVSDHFGMIEIHNRVPDRGMYVDLDQIETWRMLHWLEEAKAGDYMCQGSRYYTYQQHFKQHLDHLCGGTSAHLRDWPSDMIKFFVVVWWAMVTTTERPETKNTFDQISLGLAAHCYSRMAKALNVELV